MVNSKSGGKNVSVSDLSALRPPKPVTSSTLQQAKKSALASKMRMLRVKMPAGQYVVKVNVGAPTGTARTLSREELNSLRETKRLVANHVRRENVMSRKMDRSYFDEKKGLAQDGLNSVVEITTNLASLLRSLSYEVPNIIDPNEIHEQVRVARARLDNVRRDFEKVRWSSAETDSDFNEWLVKYGHADLVIG